MKLPCVISYTINVQHTKITINHMKERMEITRVPFAAHTPYQLICNKMGHVIAIIITDRALKSFQLPCPLVRKRYLANLTSLPF